MAVTKQGNEALKALMAAALALPGMTALAADPNVRNDKISLSYNHGEYSENQGRMDVDIDQLSVTVPIGDRYEVKLNALRDITSGASPFSHRLVNGNPVMILATAASIRETRNAFDLTGGYYGDDFVASVNAGKSIENDYAAKFVSGNYRHFFNDKATAVSVGVAFSDDIVWEKYYPAAGPRPTVYRGRYKHDLIVGVSQIINADTVASVSLAHGYAYGYLGDQYRRALVMNGKVPLFTVDTRPDDHTQWSLVGRVSRYFAAIDSALHVDYRFVNDSWGSDSHMLEAKLRTDLGSGWTIAPGLRYYTQKSADFYDVYFKALPANKLVSGDYRLAAFGAITPKLELVKRLKNGVGLRVSYENYIRSYSYKAQAGRGISFDNYKAQTISLSVEGGF